MRALVQTSPAEPARTVLAKAQPVAALKAAAPVPPVAELEVVAQPQEW